VEGARPGRRQQWPGRATRIGFDYMTCIHITPTVSWSWNIEGRSFTHDWKVVPRCAIDAFPAARDL
jgi:hypothetical protein